MTDAPQPVQLKTPPKTLALIVGGGLLAGTLIVLGAILPAEYNVDPLGLGKLTGVGRLWAPAEKEWTPGAGMDPAHTGETAIQHNTFEIPLGAADWPEAALEYKFAMKPGQSYLYRWSVVSQTGAEVKPIEFDFHGHTLAADGEEMTVAEYRKSQAASDAGSLSAPFDGIHGWYWKNTNTDPVTVKLEVWGFYTLVPPGQAGNEFRVQPLEPAAPPT